VIRFDKVSGFVQLARTGATQPVDFSTIIGLDILEVDEGSRRVVAKVDPEEWVKDESARQTSLDASNSVRAAGYRLKRVTSNTV
jgi:hypothetical protein